MAARHATRVPIYRFHKASGQAIVTLEGRMIYLGPFGSEESRERYERVISEWMAQGREPALEGAPDAISVDSLMAAFWRHAEVYYRKDGKPTSELANLRQALRFLHKLYAGTSAHEFGPLALKACREAMIEQGLSRATVNGCVSRIRLCFRWAVENELVPARVYQGLTAVRGLECGRSRARETEPVKPVSEADMRQVLAMVSRPVAAMIELQWLTGMRPNEVVQMRGRDLDRSGEVWVYRPRRHKLEHRGIEREVAIGPKGQAVLREFLKLDPDVFLFSPRDAEKERNQERQRKRQTKKWVSHDPERRRARRSKPGRRLRDHYDTASYRRAIARGCEKAGIEQWSPNQLRHAAATRIRGELGLEAAQAVLGHRLVETTQVYAEVSRSRAVDVMRDLG